MITRGLKCQDLSFCKNKNKTTPRFPFKIKSFLIPVPMVLPASYQVGSQSIQILASSSQGSKENYTNTKNILKPFIEGSFDLMHNQNQLDVLAVFN